MNAEVNVIGVGMTRFRTPKQGIPYPQMAREAIVEALHDAGVGYENVDQAFAGYVYGDSCSGHRAIYEVGLIGIPVFNVNSNCSTGSSALALARQSIAAGAAECALAVGFEQMSPGALSEHWPDRPSPLAPFVEIAERHGTDPEAPVTLRLFAAAAREYLERYGVKRETLARITVKARSHAARNPRAVFRDPLTLEEVLASPDLCDPLTRFQCCPPTCGAAAAVLCSQEFAARHGLRRQVRIRAQAVVTDMASSFAGSAIAAVGAEMGRRAARDVYEASGLGPEDVQVLEVHDCFGINEVLTYEALGLCPQGGAERLIEAGDNTYGGRRVVNPSGGLISKGHPLGATGLAQTFELVTQLRGAAGERQVEGARLALAHNIGIGGTCVVTMYERVV